MTNLTHRRFELEDVNGQPLRFDGQLLASVSSQRADQPKPRWMEMNIYKTAGGNYILRTIGQSSIEGEAIKDRSRVLATADELIDAMHNEDERGVKYITLTARDALFDAMESDDTLRTAWGNRVQEVA